MNWKILREVMMIVIGIALILLLTRLDHDVDRNYEADLRDTAVACRTQVGLGIPLAKNCLNPALLPYFDPKEDINTGAFRAQCDIARQNNMTPPKGCP